MTPRSAALLATAVAVAALAGCAKSEDKPADTAAPATAAAEPAPRTIALADVAGKWTLRSVPASGSDTTPTISTLTTTGDTTGWTMAFQDGKTHPVRVLSVAGDSIMTEVGPYSSVRRKGVMVRTQSTFRMEGGRLVGRTTARYQNAGADSVLVLRSEGTRTP